MLQYGVIRDRNGDDVLYLKIFKNTSLVKESFVRVTILEEFFKYGIDNFNLTIEYWNKEGVLKKRDMQVGLDGLVKDCEEVREFAEKYFPEYAI